MNTDHVYICPLDLSFPHLKCCFCGETLTTVDVSMAKQVDKVICTNCGSVLRVSMRYIARAHYSVDVWVSEQSTIEACEREYDRKEQLIEESLKHYESAKKGGAA